MHQLRMTEKYYSEAISGGSGTEAIANKKDAVDESRVRLDSTKREFESVTEQLMTEFQRFKIDKKTEFVFVLVKFNQLMLEYHRKSIKAWVDMPTYEAVVKPEPPSGMFGFMASNPTATAVGVAAVTGA